MNASSELLKELRLERNKAPAPPPSRGRTWIALGLGAAALAILAAWLLLGRDRAVEVRTAPVVALSAGSGNASVLDASGYVVARRMATVSAQITGRVKDVMIEEGMRVEAGQVMATLDPIDADAQRRLYASQAEAARSQIDSVGAQLREAEANAERLGPLVRQQLVSRAQYEQAIAQRDALRAQRSVAQRNAQVASEQLRVSDINLDHTVVRAPFSGVVIAKAAQPGEIVSPLSAGGGFTRTGIGTVVDMESLEVEVEVGESYIGRVQPRMPVVTVLNSYPDWRIPGEVIAIIPAADRGKATVKVRVALRRRTRGSCRTWACGSASWILLRRRPSPRPAPKSRAACGFRPRRWPSAMASTRPSWSAARTRCNSARSKPGSRWATTARCCRACRLAKPWCSLPPKPCRTATAYARPPPAPTDPIRPRIRGTTTRKMQ